MHFIIDRYSGVAANVVLVASILVFQKKKLQTQDTTILVFWAFVIGTPISAICMFIFEYDSLSVEWDTHVILLVIGYGIGACSLTVFSVLANSMTSSSIVQLTSSFHLVLLLIGQYTVLMDINPGHHNALEVIGVCTVFIGSCLVPVLTHLTDYRCLRLQED